MAEGEATPPEECQVCTYPTDRLTRYDNPRTHGNDDYWEEDWHFWACTICARTLVRLTLTHPGAYREQEATLKTVAFLGNALMDMLVQAGATIPEVLSHDR